MRAPTTPAATPHTAAWKTRSQSPPRRVQRMPLSATGAAIPRRSMRPYMWIVNGPRWTLPLDGEGIEARITRSVILPACPEAGSLEEDLYGGVRRTAAREQVDREVEVDGGRGGQYGRGAQLVARPLELLGPPALDAGGLGLSQLSKFGDGHRYLPSSLSS